MRDFRKLHVWRRAHALHIAIDAAGRQVRRREFANLRSQLIRAAESIPGNIVEGSGAATQREFARYLDIAIKSANETEYHLFAAAARGALPAAAADPLMAETVEVRRMLFGLRKRVLADPGG
jgi:four helix bundle protein